MIPIVLFLLACILTLLHLVWKEKWSAWDEVFLSYLLLFNVGLMGIIAFCGHIFMPAMIAEEIGWAPGSPFQFEVGIANLSYGILGIFSFWIRRHFWVATVIGYSVLLLGAFIGHLIQYSRGDVAPYNIGPFVWVGDLFIPILLLVVLVFYHTKVRPNGKSS